MGMMMGQGGEQGAMNPMMMMSLLGDDAGDMKDLLPLMMMQGGANGAPMDPMMMTLMGDDSGSMKDLLPLMMMNGGGQMDPMMMMMLLEDDKPAEVEAEVEEAAEE